MEGLEVQGIIQECITRQEVMCEKVQDEGFTNELPCVTHEMRVINGC